MRKIQKILIALMGGVDVIFSIFIPISVALILINVVGLGGYNAIVLWVAGVISSLYRAIDIGFMRN